MNLIQKHHKEMKKGYKHASNFPSKFEFTGNESEKLSMCSDAFPVSLDHT